jgi:sarcosine oxidase subunit alpha
VLKAGTRYIQVRPELVLVASGAREKSLAFPGNTLPGVYGAGAFQTLVNRDLVRAAGRLFIIGGGNVGLIAGYHALQAGIDVVGLVEALPECSGYKVHKDKLARFGVPIHVSHTILSANGKDQVESVTIARLENWKPVPGSERSYACDTILIAIGLDPVDEFFLKADEFGLKAYAAGDAEEIAEASAAIFSGKIRGLEIARDLHHTRGDSRAGDRRLPPPALRPGDSLRPLHHRLPAEPYPHPRLGHPRPADLRGARPGQGLHRLREVRHHLPGAGRHPGRLP